jgi:hypothetical protein
MSQEGDKYHFQKGGGGIKIFFGPTYRPLCSFMRFTPNFFLLTIRGHDLAFVLGTVHSPITTNSHVTGHIKHPAALPSKRWKLGRPGGGRGRGAGPLIGRGFQ